MHTPDPRPLHTPSPLLHVRPDEGRGPSRSQGCTFIPPPLPRKGLQSPEDPGPSGGKVPHIERRGRWGTWCRKCHVPSRWRQLSLPEPRKGVWGCFPGCRSEAGRRRSCSGRPPWRAEGAEAGPGAGWRWLAHLPASRAQVSRSRAAAHPTLVFTLCRPPWQKQSPVLCQGGLHLCSPAGPGPVGGGPARTRLSGCRLSAQAASSTVVPGRAGGPCGRQVSRECPCRAWVASAQRQGPATERASELHSRQSPEEGAVPGRWGLCNTQNSVYTWHGVMCGEPQGTVHSAGQSHRCFSGGSAVSRLGSPGGPVRGCQDRCPGRVRRGGVSDGRGAGHSRQFQDTPATAPPEACCFIAPFWGRAQGTPGAWNLRTLGPFPGRRWLLVGMPPSSSRCFFFP